MSLYITDQCKADVVILEYKQTTARSSKVDRQVRPTVWPEIRLNGCDHVAQRSIFANFITNSLRSSRLELRPVGYKFRIFA